MQITLEEYQQILEKLSLIKNEKKQLEKLSFENLYQCHLKLESTFESLIIQLTKDNKKIELEIRITVKKLLAILYENRENYFLIHEFLISFYQSQKVFREEEVNPEIKSILEKYPEYQNFTILIHDLTTKREANNFLLNYIIELSKEEKDLITKKKIFEKKVKKKKKLVSFKRK